MVGAFAVFQDALRLSCHTADRIADADADADDEQQPSDDVGQNLHHGQFPPLLIELCGLLVLAITPVPSGH